MKLCINLFTCRGGIHRLMIPTTPGAVKRGSLSTIKQTDQLGGDSVFTCKSRCMSGGRASPVWVPAFAERRDVVSGNDGACHYVVLVNNALSAAISTGFTK